MKGNNALQLQIIRDSAALEELGDEWESLWREAPSLPFQAPHWLLPWWQLFGTGQLHAIACRDRGKLVGFIPSCVAPAPVRELEFIGTGISDLLDALIKVEHRDGGVEAFFAHLQSDAAKWDRCRLLQLPHGSPLLDKAVLSALGIQPFASASCFAISLPGTVGRWREQLPRNLRENLAYYQRRSARAGAITVERENAWTLDALLDALFSLHTERWRQRGDLGAFDGGAIREFHRRSARAFLEAGVLRMHALRLNGRIAAITHGFVHQGRAYLYLSGFDPALSQFSFGTQVIAFAIEAAIREHCTEFNFLRGEEGYKRHFGASEQRTFGFLIPASATELEATIERNRIEIA